MKIFGFNQGIQQVQFDKIGLKNNKYIDKNLFVSKDTVSFSAGQNATKLIDEFKQMDPAGNYDMRTSDLLKVYEYFGFKLVKGNSSHSRLVGPYGQTTSVVISKAKVNAGAASDLIRALKRADEFNGELIIFEKEPSPEKVAEWKEKIRTRKPNPDQVNNYALDLQERLKQTQVLEPTQTVNDTKDIEIKIANTKAKIKSVIFKLNNDSKIADELKNDILSLQKLNKESKIHSTGEEVDNLLDRIVKIEKKIIENKEVVNSYSKQINNGYPLSDKNEEQLERINAEEFDFQSIKKKLTELESKYLEIQEYKEILQHSIEEVIIDSKIFTDDVTTELQKISSKLTDPSICPFINKSKKEKLDDLIKEIKTEIKLQNRQLTKYSDINPDKHTKEELEEIKNSLQKSLALRDNYAQIEEKTFAERVMVKLNELRYIFDNEIAPLSDFSTEEIEKNGSKQIEKFNKKYQKAFEQKKAEAERHKTDRTKQKPVQKPEIRIIKPEQISIEEGEETLTIEKVEQRKPVQTSGSVTQKTVENSFDKLEKSKQEMIEKLAKKVLPLPLPAVITAVKNELAKSFDFDSFGLIKGDKTKIKEFISTQMKKISKNSEFLRIKNASRFAVLCAMSKNLKSETPEIYNLNNAEITKLFEELKEGKTHIEIETIESNTPVQIELREKINVETLNSTFEKYNVSISEKQKIPNWETNKGKNIVDEMLKYTPEFSCNQIQDFILAIMEEGAYLEILVDESANDLLKLSVLKNFWKKIDSNNGTSFSPTIVEKFIAEINEKNEAKKQQEKIDSIDKIDWTL